VTEHLNTIADNVSKLLAEIPQATILVVAAKSRTPAEIHAALDAGISYFGQNYIQEAEEIIPAMRSDARWHMIGHLQRNKVNKAIPLFDMIESLDSIRLAKKIEQSCSESGIVMPVLLEINSGRESSKTGLLPKDVPALAKLVDDLPHLHLQGLMTMGPRFGSPEDARPYFQATRSLFDQLADMHLPNSEMKYLSMGMSNSYQVALEEGANIIRIGTKIFGPRS
jgi:PLP dependent protein